MYGNYSNQLYIQDLQNMKDRIDRQLQQLHQTPIQPTQPINNIINTTQNTSSDLISLRVLNDKEDIENIYVQNKTLFLGENNMVIKGVDGKIEKYNIYKTYPIDPKDKKINELEKQIKKLKEMINNEPSKFNSTIKECKQPNSNVNINDESNATKSGKTISKKE
jgi:hypothetical protein